jgi:shikimate dehydrogenase
MKKNHTYRLAGVMGSPVAHSRSPVLHKHWIEEYGLRGDYVLLPVQPSHLEQALRALPVLGFAGCNLTIPHKVAAMALVDRVDSLAQRVGAMNTVVVEKNGTLTGHNTDVFGFVQSLLDAQPQWRADAGPITVLGAGGAARAVLVSLLDSGAQEIRLSNRSDGKALDMAQEFGNKVHYVPWKERSDSLAGAALAVNTTSQGMQGECALSVSLDRLPREALVADIIYAPLQTPLLAAAKARGNATVNGLGMLINQARPAFNAWFGVMPTISAELLKKVHATL